MDRAATGSAPIALAHEAPFTLGSVTIRPATREMELDGRSAVMEPRAMQVLVALHRAAGQVVSKDDLAAICWDQRVVGDDAINRVISRLRHHAEEDGGGHFKIETITKVGYRLALASGKPLRPAQLSRRSMVGIVAGAATLAGVGAGTYFIPWHGREEEQLADIRRTWLMGTPDQLDNAATQLKNFLIAHPRSAEGWGLYAFVSAINTNLSPATGRTASLHRTEDAVKHAFALDPHSVEAKLALLALDKLFGNWTYFHRSLSELSRQSPDNLLLNSFLCRFYSQTGLYHRVLEAAEKALAVEPNAPTTVMMKALALDNLGEIASAQETIEQAYAKWPGQYAVWFTRLYLLGYNGQSQQALAMAAPSRNWPVGVTRDNQEMTTAQIKALGDRSPAVVEDALRRSLDLSPKGTGFAENAMIFSGAIGRADTFFDLAQRYFFDPGFIVGNTRFSDEQRVYSRERTTWFLFRRSTAAMWHDPRFELLVRKVGLDAFWRANDLAPEYRDMI